MDTLSNSAQSHITTYSVKQAISLQQHRPSSKWSWCKNGGFSAACCSKQKPIAQSSYSHLNITWVCVTCKIACFCFFFAQKRQNYQPVQFSASKVPGIIDPISGSTHQQIWVQSLHCVGLNSPFSSHSGNSGPSCRSGCWRKYSRFSLYWIVQGPCSSEWQKWAFEITSYAPEASEF